MTEEKLNKYYVGKFWFSGDNLMIKIPPELSEHKDFPLRKERLLLVIPTSEGLEIKNVTP